MEKYVHNILKSAFFKRKPYFQATNQNYNIMKRLWKSALVVAMTGFIACQPKPEEKKEVKTENTTSEKVRLDIYSPVKLTTDVSQLSEAEKKMIPLLIEAAKIMDGLFWKQSYGDKNALLSSIQDPATKQFAQINYGPWDRLAGNTPFVEGVGEKPAGAQFYPQDMTKEEFEKAEIADKTSLYTMIKRDEAGSLKAVPYSEAFKTELEKASGLLRQAADLAESADLKNYLNLRAEALLSDDYDASDRAWLDLKDNGIDVIIGPIENYEDQLFGYKAAFEAYVLVKDKAWSKRLEKYVAFLPELQKGLPVAKEYKKESPGTDSQLNAYDVVYYAGDCNAGSKTIAVNLPNDEVIQQEKGTRRSQLKNAMQAKYDKILIPIAETLIVPEQRKHITFEAFFANTMFHEVAHGLGIKNTINGKGTVREALKDKASALEEGKADILGLYMVKSLFEKGEIAEGELMDYYVTFVTSIFRSVRFGASSAHGKANMLRFNFFAEKGAISRDEATGLYRIDGEKLVNAMNELSELILKFQGDGDYEGVSSIMEEKGKISPSLQKDLDRLNAAGIPVDIVFEQGTEVLGL